MLHFIIHSSPGPVEWCDHWKQCVWFVPGSGISISKGGEIDLHATHDDISISYNLNTQVSTTEILHDGLTTGDFQLLLPPERAAIYGDEEWRLSMLKAVKSVVSYSSHKEQIVNKSTFLLFIKVNLSYFDYNNY
jgi:protein arginine N-methyltransferase 7